MNVVAGIGDAGSVKGALAGIIRLRRAVKILISRPSAGVRLVAVLVSSTEP